jgi:transposase-like protein
MTGIRGRPTGRCITCAHLERVRIELELASGGASLAAVARKYGIGRDALGRHWAGHVSEERKASLVLGPVQRAALAARVCEESESVLDHHKAVRAGLYFTYDAAVTARDRQSVALLAGRLTEVNNSIARLTGQLATSPLVQINNSNQVVTTLIESPEFAAFRADLIRVLSRFPDAYEAVLQEFDRLEALSAELPALEHQSEAIEAA